MTDQPTLTLTDAQSRLIAVTYIANQVCTMKQYLTNSQLEKYKFMLREFSTLPQQDAIAERFNKCWPDSLKWEDV